MNLKTLVFRVLSTRAERLIEAGMGCQTGTACMDGRAGACRAAHTGTPTALEPHAGVGCDGLRAKYLHQLHSLSKAAQLEICLGICCMRCQLRPHCLFEARQAQ
eukprot:1426267-Pyramimonas_sp.AAC.1